MLEAFIFNIKQGLLIWPGRLKFFCVYSVYGLILLGFKTISLSDEAYRMLASLKREGESFTDVVVRLCSKVSKKPLASFAGVWVMSDEEEKAIFSKLLKLWRKYEKALLNII